MDSIWFPSPRLPLSLQLQLMNHFIISGEMKQLFWARVFKSTNGNYQECADMLWTRMIE